MIMKKRLKTKIDYQIRTFGICVTMIALFTALIITPRMNKLEESNELIKTELDYLDNENLKLKNEFEGLIQDTTIMAENN